MYYTFKIDFEILKSLKISELCPFCRLKDTCKYKCNKQLAYERLTAYDKNVRGE